MHIVCFDVPYPPDYGGVTDVFCKIKHLSAQGVAIILHCFEYGRGQRPELEQYCENVFYYPRQQMVSLKYPYIVISRKNRLLRERLLADTHPVLLEGVHCTYHLYRGDLQSKKSFVRVHNIEHRYYRNLARYEKNLFKKIYFLFESWLLKSYEHKLAARGRFLCLSLADAAFYRSMGAVDAGYLPIFVNATEVSSQPGLGSYCLYHGNLAISENVQAVKFLIEEVFSRSNHRLVIAGRNPTRAVRRMCSGKNIRLISDPGEQKMLELIVNAQISILPSFNNTGVKVKIIESLFRGRFVITNQQGAHGMRSHSLCQIYSSAADLVRQIDKLMSLTFTQEDAEERSAQLSQEFDDAENAGKLISLLF